MPGGPSDAHVFLGHPCWHCRHWGGWVNGANSWCARPNDGHVVGQPKFGCAFFEREPGTDDEAGPPPVPPDLQS